MAAIGLAAAQLELEDPDALVGSFAADHVIAGDAAFAGAVREAAEVAAQGWLVTIGIEPTHPATGFGYIRSGQPLGSTGSARVVAEFVEKPDAQRAADYVRSGEYRWNAGMFIVRAATLLDLLAENHPDLATGLREIAVRPELLHERWPELTRIAIDHAVAEPAAAAGRVATVPGSFAWEDLGDFASLAAMTAPQDGGVRVLGDANLVVSQDATGLVVPAGGRTVAVVGLDDVVVVDTGDALLVTTSARAQDVKGIVATLKGSGRADLT
jgi:mannose-1-phosphate guanylyltransferase